MRRSFVENYLKAMCKDGVIKKEGKGRAAFYYALDTSAMW